MGVSFIIVPLKIKSFCSCILDIVRWRIPIMLDYFIFEMLIPATVNNLNFKHSVMLKNKQKQFNNFQKQNFIKIII